MNILILNWRDKNHPNAGGAETVTMEHAKGWVHAGHTVWFFTSLYKGAKSQETIEGIHIIRKGRAVFGVQAHAFFWYLFSHHPVFDVVIDQFHGIPFFTPLYVRKKKIAFIHEVAKNVWKYNTWQKPFNLIPWVIGGIFEPLLFILLYRNTPFMTVSHSTQKDLMSWGIRKKNIHVIENGIRVVMPASLKKESILTITYLGALAKDKGIEDALVIFSYIQQLLPSCQFWVIGKGSDDYVIELKKQAKNLQINNLTFLGYVSEKEKYSRVARSHLLINPSIREGWGLVVIEGAHMGTPTIGYAVAGLNDSVLHNKTGILCPIHDYTCISEEAVALLNDKKRYEKMRNEAIEWSNTFQWEKSVKKSLALLNN